ncbi:MAG: glycoside hydrolase family 99-like domain-containing protein, partial [Agathobacter sp.]|nr:glycoside hydrolase family 99-like domain-containing protein [Agathobacter sp.]
ILTDYTPEAFETHLHDAFKLLSLKNNKLCFIKAWNEWGDTDTQTMNTKCYEWTVYFYYIDNICNLNIVIVAVRIFYIIFFFCKSIMT